MKAMTSGISCEGMSPEWVAREGKKGDTIIRAGMSETMGEVETALGLYAVAAAEEEELAEYCEGIGLHEKAYYHWLGAADCWGRAGNLHRGIQIGEKMLTLDILTPHKRKQVETMIERLRDERREWYALSQQRQQKAAQQRTEPARSGETVAV